MGEYVPKVHNRGARARGALDDLLFGYVHTHECEYIVAHLDLPAGAAQGGSSRGGCETRIDL